MSKHPEPIRTLIERSSLGSKEARTARSTVPRAVGHRLAAAANASITGRHAHNTGIGRTTGRNRRG